MAASKKKNSSRQLWQWVCLLVLIGIFLFYPRFFSFALLVIILCLIIGIILDIMEKRFYWLKFALAYFLGMLLLVLFNIKSIYQLTSEFKAANEKIYKNDQLGFSFHYDKDSEIVGQTKDGTDHENTVLLLTLKDPALLKDNQYQDDVNYFTILAVTQDSPLADCEKSPNAIKTLIGGVDGYYEETLEPKPTYMRGFCVTNGAYTYLGTNEFTYPEHKYKTERLFNTIKSSFKFLHTLPDEMGTVPIYPGATFVKKENMPLCSSFPPEEAERTKIFFKCDTAQYTFTTPENFEKVVDWYSNDTSHSGWKLHGGAGVEGIERYGNLSNESKNYWINIGEKTSKTYFEIRIPKE